MPTTDAIIAGTGASLAGIGTAAWVNASNITASDDTRVTLGLNGVVSNWLVATNFDFSTIPNDAIILGVTGTVEASRSSGTSVTITAASLVVGDAAAGTQLAPSQAVTTSDANYTIDLSPPVVGYPITPAVLKVSTTGFAISCTGVGLTTARIDAMWLTIQWLYQSDYTRVPRLERTGRGNR